MWIDLSEKSSNIIWMLDTNEMIKLFEETNKNNVTELWHSTQFNVMQRTQPIRNILREICAFFYTILYLYLFVCVHVCVCARERASQCSMFTLIVKRKE